MLKKKICLVGPPGVGKTSLVRKYVLNIFSEDYLSTVGVKVDKKNVTLDSGEDVSLLIWDLEGHKVVNDILPLYLRGMAAYFLVADGTDEDSLRMIVEIASQLTKDYPQVPCLCIINKADLLNDWILTPEHLEFFEEKEIPVLQASAKTGHSVEEAFTLIAHKAVLEDGNG